MLSDLLLSLLSSMMSFFYLNFGELNCLYHIILNIENVIDIEQHHF